MGLNAEYGFGNSHRLPDGDLLRLTGVVVIPGKVVMTVSPGCTSVLMARKMSSSGAATTKSSALRVPYSFDISSNSIYMHSRLVQCLAADLNGLSVLLCFDVVPQELWSGQLANKLPWMPDESHRLLHAVQLWNALAGQLSRCMPGRACPTCTWETLEGP